jgi:tetratricopeptide (TPR) repeat protein
VGDPRTAVRTVFSWSCQNVAASTAQAFGLLGLHPGRDFDPYDVAALGDTDLSRAQASVDQLAQAHLLETNGCGLFAMHDLLHAYARECAPDTQEPLTRLFDHYVHTAALATDALFPHDQSGRPEVASARTPVPALSDPAAALSWLDQHRSNLVAIARFAAVHGWPQHSVDLSRILWRHFEVGGHYQEALATHSSAVDAAYRNPGGSAGSGLPSVLANLGNVHWWLGDYRVALTHFERALTGHRDAADPDGEARALARLGIVHERLGDYGSALTRLEEALTLYRATGNRHGEGVQLLNLGALHRRYGRYSQAATDHELAAALFAEVGDRRLEGYALGNLGADLGLLGRHAEALDHLRRALAHCEESADPGGQGSAIAAIGTVYRRLGQFSEALDQLNRALRISRDISDRALETEVLNSLGETLHAMGEAGAALERHQAALALTERTGDQFEQARALDGIAQVCAEQGEVARAHEHWRQALAIYLRLGAPEADPVRANLSSASR